jgi:hypothetical protein
MVMGASLPERQLQEFEAELRRRGRLLDEFELSARDRIGRDGSSSQPSWVSVRHVESGTSRDYRYGQWLFDFVRDLDAGGFKRGAAWRDNPAQKLGIHV